MTAWVKTRLRPLMSDDSSSETPPEPAQVPALAEERLPAHVYSVKLPTFEGPLDLLLH
jgi:hypothetical protein